MQWSPVEGLFHAVCVSPLSDLCSANTGWGKVGVQLWMREAQSSFMYHYLLIVVLLPTQTTVNLLCPRPPPGSSFSWQCLSQSKSCQLNEVQLVHFSVTDCYWGCILQLIRRPKVIEIPCSLQDMSAVFRSPFRTAIHSELTLCEV